MLVCGNKKYGEAHDLGAASPYGGVFVVGLYPVVWLYPKEDGGRN